MGQILTAFTVVISLINILVTLVVFAGLRKKYRYPLPLDFFAFLFLASFIMWYLVPAVLRLFSNSQYELAVGIDNIEILQVYLYETISLISYLAAFPLIFKTNKFSFAYLRPNTLIHIMKRSRATVKSLYVKKDRSLNAFQFLSNTIIVYYFLKHMEMRYGIDVGIYFSLFDWFIAPLALKAGPILILHNVFISHIQENQFKYYIWFSLLVLTLILGVASGSHGSVIGPILYIAFHLIFFSRPKSIIAISLVAVGVTLIFAEEMHATRAMNLALSQNELSAIDNLLLIADSSEHQTDENSLLDRVEWRFGENSRKSVGYIRMYERGFSADIMPVLNSMYILPRSMITNKPIPGSIDGTELGVGMRLMHREIEGTLWNMSGFFTGLHYYWEFGMLGMIIYSLISGCYSATLLLYAIKSRFLGLPLMIIMHDTWWAMPKLWISEIVVHFFNVLLPLIALWLVVSFIFRIKSRILLK